MQQAAKPNINQWNPDYHGFPSSIDAFAGNGKITKIKGGDGIVSDKIELRGDWMGKSGTFEWIIEPNKLIIVYLSQIYNLVVVIFNDN